MSFIFPLLVMLLSPPTASGYASEFGGLHDKHAGGNALCLGRRTLTTDWGIATRRGKCGDLFILQNPRNGRWVIVPRIDSGPWRAFPRKCKPKTIGQEVGHCRARHGRTMVRLRKGYTYGRNVADATKRVMRALGHRGIGAVRIWRLR